MPFKKMKYKINCPVISNEDPEDQRYKISVFGEGRDGSLSLEPAEMNFGIIMVNFVKSGKFVLTNNSETTFFAHLSMEVEGGDESRKEELLSYLTSDFSSGLIPSKSQKDFTICFNPKNICDFKVKIVANV